jgi:hypothetical protein
MSLLHAWWLLALPPLLTLVFLVARAGRRAVPMTQHRVAVWLRMAGVSLLVLALAQPILVMGSSQRSVLFLLRGIRQGATA